MTYDNMVELYNQTSIYIGNKDSFFWGHPALPENIVAQLEDVTESMKTPYQTLHSTNKAAALDLLLLLLALQLELLFFHPQSHLRLSSEPDGRGSPN